MPITRLGLVFSSQLCFASPSVEFTLSKAPHPQLTPDKKLTAIVHARNQIKTLFFAVIKFFLCVHSSERERRERAGQPESRTIQV